MGPIEILYCWQSVLCALAVVGIMKAVTAAIALSIGREKMVANRWLSVFILPMVTVLVGFTYAACVPLRPDIMVTYITEHVPTGGWRAALAYGMWGAACGQFAQTIYDRVNDMRGGGTRPVPLPTGTKLAVAAQGGTDERP